VDNSKRDARENNTKNLIKKIPINVRQLRGNISSHMYLREVGWEIVDWTELAQDWDQWRALVNTVMKIWVS
jgi:hypothetical protein